MEYSVNRLAKLAGVSARTLHYYDEIGLLSPKRISSNGYRIYGQKEVDLLQQILFYRELGMQLEQIKLIISDEQYNSTAALQEHLAALLTKRDQIDRLISTVKKTISSAKGEVTMSDKEKFAGFKRSLIEENEKNYGEEIRSKYGDKEVDDSNKKLMGLTQEEYDEMQRLSEEFNETLKAAFAQGDPAGELAQKACQLHKEWLCFSWKEYTKEAHVGLAQTYVDDPRFTQYYDNIAKGCSEFLRDAIVVYCQ